MAYSCGEEKKEKNYKLLVFPELHNWLSMAMENFLLSMFIYIYIQTHIYVCDGVFLMPINHLRTCFCCCTPLCWIVLHNTSSNRIVFYTFSPVQNCHSFLWEVAGPAKSQTSVDICQYIYIYVVCKEEYMPGSYEGVELKTLEDKEKQLRWWGSSQFGCNQWVKDLWGL